MYLLLSPQPPYTATSLFYRRDLFATAVLLGLPNAVLSQLASGQRAADEWSQ
jgi:hypothetical protein